MVRNWHFVVCCLFDICDEIEEDGILNDVNKINGVLDVLKARGYKYKTVDNIPQFGL